MRLILKPVKFVMELKSPGKANPTWMDRDVDVVGTAVVASVVGTTVPVVALVVVPEPEPHPEPTQSGN